MLGARAEHALDSMRGHLTAADDRCASAVGDGWALSVAARTTPQMARDAGRAVAVLGEPKFLDTSLEGDARRDGVATVVLREYPRCGPELLRSLRGPFVLAMTDAERGEALLAVDRMGIGSLAWCKTATGIVFATSCHAINRHPGVTPRLDSQALFDYAWFHVVPAPRTAFKGQNRIDAGTFVHLRDGRTTTVRYWSPVFDESGVEGFGPLKEQFRQLMRSAVEERSAAPHTGSFLSGGTDSSTVAGLLREIKGRPVPTFSIGFDVPEYDELHYARIAAKRFETEQHEYLVTPADVVDALPLIARMYDTPFGNASAVPTFQCAKLARQHGVTRLLAGDGGDELFGGNARYAVQRLLEAYQSVPSFFRRIAIEPAAELPIAERVPLIRKARSYVAQARIALPDRLESYNLVARIGVERIFERGFLATVDLEAPARAQRSRYAESADHALINRMLAYDFKFTLADNDLPKVTRMCDAAGVDVAFPMLDDRLVEFASRLAPEMKLRGTKLRWFFKEALRDFLPHEIITKTKHGFGLPVGIWLTKVPPLAAFARDHLAHLKTRGVVRPAFIDELWSTLLPSHPAYYGTLIWLLMMLELWYREHWDPLGSGS